ncbi:Ger(x)C family spore germination protein [Paenibacillus sp. J5C_2022]|uniref:Ger(x)C family spore germination protein n=1 Tax=Paenibacillus sp. J5C2022 TaxID=2977129 RepID=UPI0021D0B81D|nr:Ger(x)C family spore germination protein [Paenibacillus sp. J5C2022]MCU6708500.1 Ger(x)C family spore germination protein [Paenibacillus sp. J5C2022]
MVPRLLAVCLVAMSIMLAATGCWDIQYLDKLGVVMAIGVDKDHSGKHRFKITVQTVLPQNAVGVKGGDGSPVMTLSDTGDTLFEAMRKMSAKTSRRLYFSHTQLLLISEEVAREGIYPIMDLIERNSNVRSDISVMITRGLRAEQLLQIQTQMESIPANQMKDSVVINQKVYGKTYNVQVRDIAHLSESAGMQAAVPAIGIDGLADAGNSKKSVDVISMKVKPELKAMAVFRNGKLRGYLTPEQSRGLAWIQNKIKNTAVKQRCRKDKGHYIIEVIKSDTKIKARKGDNGLPLIEIEVRLKAAMHEVVCPDMHVHDEAMLRQMEKKLDETVEAEIMNAIHKVQKELGADALGWGVATYHYQPKLWKQLYRDWEHVFPDVPSRVKCISEIISTGVRSDTIPQ